MEPSTVNPYAPPEAAATGSETTTYLQEDGYVFHDELVANSHFRSPLICAKTGVPIQPETNPVHKLITVTRTPKVSGFLNHLISALASIIFVIIIIFVDSSKTSLLVIPLVLVNIFVSRFLSKPYQIPFYFSEKYTRSRSNLICLLICILIVSVLFMISGILTNYTEAIILAGFGFIIISVILKFKTTYFIVTQTKGEYHYIRGVHKNLLNTLPHLPLSN